jgi:hypothetical protein
VVAPRLRRRPLSRQGNCVAHGVIASVALLAVQFNARVTHHRNVTDYSRRSFVVDTLDVAPEALLLTVQYRPHAGP